MEQLTDRILKALQDAGIAAVRAIPDRVMPRLKGPVTAVATQKAEAVQPGFFQYLGVIQDPETGEQELYGRRLTATVLLDTVSPPAKGAAECAGQVERLSQALLTGIEGVQIRTMQTEGCRFDPASGCFRQSLQVEVQAWLYAVQLSEDQLFTDFTLKGDWK